jgi:hypothetical protein
MPYAAKKSAIPATLQANKKGNRSWTITVKNHYASE